AIPIPIALICIITADIAFKILLADVAESLRQTTQPPNNNNNSDKQEKQQAHLMKSGTATTAREARTQFLQIQARPPRSSTSIAPAADMTGRAGAAGFGVPHTVQARTVTLFVHVHAEQVY